MFNTGKEKTAGVSKFAWHVLKLLQKLHAIAVPIYLIDNDVSDDG